ncbi:MAG: 50S ribosomal protein L28 [bacterium]|nr:50S ribosomal protein L28 [bacterium]
MARTCELTGIHALTGHKVSHSNIKTSMRQHPNLQKKKYHLDELSQTVTLTLSTRAIRTIDKLGGLSRALLTSKEEKLSPRLLKLKHRIAKAAKPKAKKSA